ncbi:MAG: hypothetical protein FJ206_07405 [Gemmatimonadetes bacterium]|nr:hypothetical protein [Gemmatimonadota bacterium]
MPIWALWILGIIAAGLATGWLARRAIRRWAQRTLFEFRARLDRYKLVESGRVRSALLADARVIEAIAEAAARHGLPRARVERQVAEYIDEIVPFFNVLSYYKIGFRLSKLLTRLFYHASVEYQDHDGLNKIPRRDVVLYLMNHRSNMDYVVVTYVLAQVVSISYAVGEWARTWPLEYIFKSFGSYFIRRKFREPLYHRVLERYIQLITRHRVTQGIFPEGGLSRDGRLGPAKIGLLDYLVGTLGDPAFDGDIWLVPVALNYDRVLEDQTLTRELIVGGPRPSRLGQVWGWVSFAAWNVIQLLAGRRHRYGRVAVNFGSPLSARDWLAKTGLDVPSLPRPDRLPQIQRLADEVMARVGAIVPVTPVPLVSMALLSFPAHVVPKDRVLERVGELRDRLRAVNAKVVRSELGLEAVWDRAWRTFRARRMVVDQGEAIVILPNARPLLQYYANSIGHLVEPDLDWELTPAAGDDPTTPRLKSPRPSA